MIRHLGRFASVAALAVSTAALPAIAQQTVPAAPPEQPAAASQAPAAPAPTTAPAFPKPDPKNFTATSPTNDQVNGFLRASWGYDENRVWEVAAIMKTQVEGLSKVIVYVGDKSGKEKPSAFLFWAMPDGKHIIAGDDVYPFGDDPYADNRAKLQASATGPYRGSASKDLLLVEFADFECPHCKAVQPDMDKLATDFPKARIVYQNYPLERIHPEAKLAAEYGVCVAKLGGSSAFFQFANAVYEGQDGLANADGAALTLNSAATKAGQDSAKVAACAKEPATGDEVEKQVKLAQDLNINQTPTLMINGRQVPIGGVPYDTLKKIVEYQAKMDGVKQ
ncbi:MAG TPA: thioredoxin domain-containing protein [Terracidiphilus sp.]|nr:thioredoxin domain-containing protein [Terracidiphilus sp.]